MTREECLSVGQVREDREKECRLTSSQRRAVDDRKGRESLACTTVKRGRGERERGGGGEGGRGERERESEREREKETDRQTDRQSLVCAAVKKMRLGESSMTISQETSRERV